MSNIAAATALSVEETIALNIEDLDEQVTTIYTQVRYILKQVFQGIRPKPEMLDLDGINL
jgi:hypothetical protein